MCSLCFNSLEAPLSSTSPIETSSIDGLALLSGGIVTTSNSGNPVVNGIGGTVEWSNNNIDYSFGGVSTQSYAYIINANYLHSSLPYSTLVPGINNIISAEQAAYETALLY